MTIQYDAIVIGTGQAGPALAARLSKEGLRTAVIERKHFGGTCVNNGCVPTKTLVASAYVAHMARRAADYGVTVGGDVGVDMARVKARKDQLVERGRNGIGAWMEGLPDVTVHRGHARFEGPRTVRVNGDLLSAERIFINTGGRAVVPDMPGLDQVDYLTNSTVMDLDTLPDHLIVVGGSYIGLEFAQVYRRFGSRVTVVEMADRLIPREDPEVSETIRGILEGEGIEIRLKAECLAVERDGAGIAMRLGCANGAPRITGSHMLLAVGRRPNTGDLGLDAAGIATDKRGYITVDDTLATSVPGVWALGDVNGRGAFTHTAYNDYEIVAANLFDGDARRVSDRIPCYALFTDPPLGRVGLTEREVRERGIPALVARRDMTSVGRARERGETLGFMKVLVDAQSQRILGAALLGIAGDEVVQGLLDVMAADAPYTVIARSMHIHPTVAEYLPTMMGELQPLD
jgi:pyruvate/2-oxoglutarate dehydrogenase complex dihydrolipoamide dehydrogenase (E3) component